jgi:hypothetical protein
LANVQVTGTVILRVDGKSVRSKPGAKLMFGGVERSEEVADGQIIGYFAKPVASEIAWTMAHTADTDVDAMNRMTDSTIAFECDSGPVYTVRSAFLTKPCELTGDGNGVSCAAKGQAAVQTS